MYQLDDNEKLTEQSNKKLQEDIVGRIKQGAPGLVSTSPVHIFLPIFGLENGGFPSFANRRRKLEVESKSRPFRTGLPFGSPTLALVASAELSTLDRCTSGTAAKPTDDFRLCVVVLISKQLETDPRPS
jgi:hypothetical protein